MFRTIVIRATRSSLPRRVMLSAAPVLRPAVPVVQAQRFNSTRLHSAGPDWSAPVITYEELKPRTEQPKEVGHLGWDWDGIPLTIDCSRLDPSSVPLPLSVFAEALRAPEDEFRNKHGFKKPTQNQEIIVYCRSGKRSATAADIAHKYGFSNVKNYSGSWLDWSKREGENRG
ncbi:Endoplasmic reticulum protein [Rhizoctonia solani]|uniref:Endoplasmic reticulum protein n=1 Tax=Rhizoctonia solani TaxID=456999 RepID=A0A8H7M6G8_9AGAM|nr:Endoplasmic reticulum protein [Rhizoctonia solani]